MTRLVKQKPIHQHAKKYTKARLDATVCDLIWWHPDQKAVSGDRFESHLTRSD